MPRLKGGEKEMEIVTITTELLGLCVLFVGGSYVIIKGLKSVFEKFKL